MDELKKRKTPRYQSFDYNSTGLYFLTLCTLERRCILSRIVGTGVPDCPRTELTVYGKVADKYIKQLNEFYKHLSIEAYVIMPNHIHLLLWVKENKKNIDNGQSRTPVPTKSRSFLQVKTNSVHTIDNGQSRTPVPTNVERANTVCSQFVSTFKRFCNKEYGENIWQARFNDHIIRNRDDYDQHVKYIYENPIHWYYDELYSEE